MSAVLNNLSFADRYTLTSPYFNIATKALEIVNSNIWSFLQQQFQDIRKEDDSDMVGECTANNS